MATKYRPRRAMMRLMTEKRENVIGNQVKTGLISARGWWIGAFLCALLLFVGASVAQEVASPTGKPAAKEDDNPVIIAPPPPRPPQPASPPIPTTPSLSVGERVDIVVETIVDAFLSLWQRLDIGDIVGIIITVIIGVGVPVWLNRRGAKDKKAKKRIQELEQKIQELEQSPQAEVQETQRTPQNMQASEKFKEGNAESGLGQHAKAILDYAEAIRLWPDFAEAYYNSGCAKTALGQYAEAIADYDKRRLSLSQISLWLIIIAEISKPY